MSLSSRPAGPLRLGLIVAAVLALAACTGSKFTPTAGAPALEPYKGEVRELDRLPRKGGFQRLGVVVVTGPEDTSDERIRRRVRSVAADRGANAVVYQGPIKLAPYEDGFLQKRVGAFAIRIGQ